MAKVILATKLVSYKLLHLTISCIFCILSFLSFSQNNFHQVNSDGLRSIGRNELPLNRNDLLQWDVPDNSMVQVSNDGKYFAYGYKDAEGAQGRQVLIVQSTNKLWKREFSNATPVLFSSDNRSFVFKHLDSLIFLKLGTLTSPIYITNVVSYKQPENKKGEWIAYQLKDESKTLILKNLLNEKEYRYTSVSGYGFDKNGNCLVLQIDQGKMLKWISFQTMNAIDIFQTQSGTINSVVIDSKGEQIAFTVNSKANGEHENSVWYYKAGMPKAIFKVNNTTAGIDNGLYILPSLEFINDAQYLFLKLQNRPEALKPSERFINLNVWNYQDSLLQSTQVKRNNKFLRTYFAALYLDESQPTKIQQIELDHQQLAASNQVKRDYVVVRDRTKAEKIGERFWMPFVEDYYLVSLKNGSRTLLQQHGMAFRFSPYGRYLIYYNDSLESYFSYDLVSLKSKNISHGIPKGWLTVTSGIYYAESHNPIHQPFQIAGWLPNDAGVVVYDNYDIWLLDLAGNKEPINLTAGYGRSHHIKFNMLESDRTNTTIIQSENIIVAAYNMQTKYNGFFQVSLKKKENPRLLFMGPYTFHHWSFLDFHNEIDKGMKPIKSDNATSWIVQRQSFNEAPNYFLTSDFKQFQQLTDFKPQANHNWLTAELVEFNQEDGTLGHGILYKPENFDPTKKYPVIFNYYEEMTNRLYEFPIPRFIEDANLNIPWLVSHGYLVFTPDVYFTKYLPGPSASNAVVGAAKWMSKQPFVDAKRMGISGHSWGGGLTTFLVTQTHIFAAAFEGAGISDLVSSSLQIAITDGRSRLGVTSLFYPLLWKQPDTWTRYSPIMNADKVTTPLLMFHCRPDGAVPFEQAVEFFLALQRLDKKVWLLEYEEGDHNLGGKDAQDMTIRVTQYFNHNLKSAPAPIWMSRGIPARLKGIETGYAYDPSGTCGKDCKVCKMWNEKMKKDSIATLKEIEKRKIEEHWQ